MRTGKVRSNPIITSEMKIKMRGWRTALGIAAYLGVLMLIGFLYYMAFIQTNMSWNSSVNARQEAGMQIYIALAVVQFALILLITPAQTAGTVSGERRSRPWICFWLPKSPPSALFWKAHIFNVLYSAFDHYIHSPVQPGIPVWRRHPGRYVTVIYLLYDNCLCRWQHRHILFHPVQADGNVNGGNLYHHFLFRIGKRDLRCIYDKHSIQRNNAPAFQSNCSFCAVYKSGCRSCGYISH